MNNIFAYKILKVQWKYVTVLPYELQTNIYPVNPVQNKYVSIDLDGIVRISKDYAWDGPSGPTIDTPDTMRASLIHDGLYQLMHYGLDHKHRKEIDELFRKLLLEDKMFRFRAFYYYVAVRLFGGVTLWVSENLL